MKRVPWPLLIALALGAAGCRGPGYYEGKSPLEIAGMVEVDELGAGEAGYNAPLISSGHQYRLNGRKNLDNGRTNHALRLIEFASAEDRSADWARATAERRVCRLEDAGVAAMPDGSPAQPTTFAIFDRQTSCTPYQDCETTERTYQKKSRDEDGEKQTKLVDQVVRECQERWRCQSERRYEVDLSGPVLRAASALEGGMQVELDWDCGDQGRHHEVLDLPEAYLQGYLLAVDRDP
jgi:hypothetical protein